MTFYDITLQKRFLCLLRPNEQPVHVPKGTYTIYSHFKLECNKQNQLNQSNQQNYNTKQMGVYREGDEHMRFCKIQCKNDCHQWSILKGHYKTLKLLIWGVFGLLLTHRFRILQKKSKITHHKSHITHHKSHI